MNKKLFLCLILSAAISSILLFPARLSAQLSVIEGTGLGMTPAQLVQTVLVGGGVTVSNVSFNGSTGNIASTQLGSFTTAGSATTQLGFSSGIILASGMCSTAIGPNTSGSSGITTNTGSDPDLAMLVSPNAVKDKAILEFDFVPIADTLRFRYVLGSEEFDEFCMSTFNDAFGFFVSGPGLSGPFSNNAVNIALMPGSSQYVTINNVCADSVLTSWWNSGVNFQYDRITNVFTAMVIVQACQQYHIKIAIGDVADGSYDSGVFIEANSFSTNGLSFETTYSSNIDTVAVEGCNNAIISFMLAHPATDTIVVHYLVGGTAVEGADYPAIPDSLVIVPGQDSISITIVANSDGIAEPAESVIISYLNSVCGTMDTILIWIKDYTPVNAVMSPDVLHCDGSSANISVTATGGYPPLTYMWDNGAGTTSAATVTPAVPTMYTVTVSDECNFATIDSVMVSISNLADTIISVDSVSCFGYHDGSVTSLASNGIQPYHYVWSPSGDTTATADSLAAGTYFLTITDAIGCSVTSFAILSNPPGITVQLTPTDESCLNSCDGQASVQVTGLQIPPYQYAWNTNPVQTNATATGLCAGNYIVTVTYSPNNCIVTGTTTLSTNTLLNASFTESPMTGYVPFDVSFYFDGFGAATYLWDFGDGDSSTLENPVHTYTVMGTYTVTLTINSGNPDFCSDVYTMTVIAVQPSSLVVPNVFSPNGDGRNDKFQIESEGIQSLHVIVYNRWGKKVYEFETANGISTSKTKTDLWDGRTDGGAQSADGTYYYILEAKGYDGKEFSTQGTVTLIR